ncbi:MAG: hypothetical protein D6719_10470 [Candidatus Dadabacteria bacterium]|nr:MAG: hypothetical protein D6719_10470 [Candidatus Dadabacteria bacterium]
MKIKCTSLELQLISKEINSGRPLWGILRANEYFEASDPIRKALAKLAAEKLKASCYRPLQPVIKTILDGTRLGDLPASISKRIREIKENSLPALNTRGIPTPRLRKNYAYVVESYRSRSVKR